MNERAEDFPRNPSIQDINLPSSQASRTSREKKDTQTANGEIKAFPLVCVCLPEHWQKIVDQENRTSQIVSMNISNAYEKPAESELRHFPPDNGTGETNPKRFGGSPDNNHAEKRQ